MKLTYESTTFHFKNKKSANEYMVVYTGKTGQMNAKVYANGIKIGDWNPKGGFACKTSAEHLIARSIEEYVDKEK
jgi:hypothetical protein